MTTNYVEGLVPEFTMGDRLRKARELTGLEQGDFAVELGVSRGTVSNYERGDISRPKPIVVRAWALATGVSLVWLETGVEPHDGGGDGGTATRRYFPLMAA